MKTLTIEIIDEEYDRLAQMADVLDLTPEEFLFREGINFIVEGMECDLADNLVCRIWDTLEEAQEAAAKADRYDETAYIWHFYRRPDGMILVEASERHHESVIADGNEFVMCGQSVNWREVAA